MQLETCLLLARCLDCRICMMHRLMSTLWRGSKASQPGGAPLVESTIFVHALKPWANCSCAHVSKGNKSRYSISCNWRARAAFVICSHHREGGVCRRDLVCRCQIAFACVCVHRLLLACVCSSSPVFIRVPGVAARRSWPELAARF